MKLAVLLAAALQFIDPMLDLDDVECMCASLINQVSIGDNTLVLR